MMYVPTRGFRNLNTDKVPQVTKIFHSELFLKVLLKRYNSQDIISWFQHVINIKKKEQYQKPYNEQTKNGSHELCLNPASFGHLEFIKPTLWVLV